MNRSTPFVPSGARPHSQQGVILVIALALLLVIGFSSSYILRNALFGNLVSNSQAQTQLANQVAEIALRHCEERVRNPGANAPTVADRPAEGALPALWRTQANWAGPAVITIPDAIVNITGGSSARQLAFNQLPQCLIEQVDVLPSKQSPTALVVQITARGYSPDYDRAAGQGAEVMLQSTLRFERCPAGLTTVPDCNQ